MRSGVDIGRQVEGAIGQQNMEEDAQAEWKPLFPRASFYIPIRILWIIWKIAVQKENKNVIKST